MVSSIGPSPERPSEVRGNRAQAAKNGSTPTSWKAQVSNIEDLVKNGKNPEALKQLEALISTLQNHQPQSLAISTALQELNAARTHLLHPGASTDDVLNNLEKASQSLTQ